MAVVTMRWQGVDSIRRFDNALKALGSKQMVKVMNRAVNRAGDMTRTAAHRALVKQTGLKSRYVLQRLKKGTRRSSWENLSYTITASGGDIPLKYFDARETRAGVSAKPFGRRQVFAHTFIKGGLFPNRKDIGRGGHVFTPHGKGWGRPFTLTESGVVFPTEMVSGESAAAWMRVGTRVLPQRLEHEIKVVTDGVVS